jgi:hypothetical protein
MLFEGKAGKARVRTYALPQEIPSEKGKMYYEI